MLCGVTVVWARMERVQPIISATLDAIRMLLFSKVFMENQGLPG